MRQGYLRNKRGLVLDVKSILIPVTILGFILGVVLNQAFKKKEVEVKASLPKEEVRKVEVPMVKKTKSAALSDTQNTLMRLKDYMDNLKETNAFLQQNNELQKTLLDSRDKELAAVQAMDLDLKKDFESRVSDLQSQLTQRNSEVSALSEMKVDLENQVKELKSEAGAFFSAHAALGNQLDQLQKDRLALTAEIDKLKEDVKNRMAVNETLQVAMTSLTGSLKKNEQEKSALLKQLEQLQTDRRNAEARLEDLKAVKAGNESRIAELERRLDEMQRLYDETKGYVSQTARIQMQEVIAERDHLRAALSEKDAQLIELNSQLMEQKKHGLTRDLSIREREQGTEDLRRELARRNLRLQTLEAERDEARRRAVQMEQELNEQVSFNESLKEMLRDLTSDLELLRAEKEFRS